jgi:hypothetical protein
MTAPEELDQALRAKLRAAAEGDPIAARSEARQAELSRRVLAAARAERSGRARWQRPELLAAFAAAAAVLLALWLKDAPGPVESAREGAEHSAQPAPGATCGLPTSPALEPFADGAQALSLGRFGRVIAESDSTIKVEESTPCRLTLSLEHGFIAADLAKLAPAELHVRTSHGTVVVRGTRFSVRANDELEVVLLSGRVDIQDGSTHVLEPQQVFRTRHGARQRLAAEPAQAQHITRLLEANSAVAAPAPAAAQLPPAPATSRAPAPSALSTGELLRRAEAARRGGKLGEARALYAQASAGRDDDAEVALLRWSRLELDARAFARAAELLDAHKQRFAAGKLHAEAAWLRVLTWREQGNLAEARRAAQALIARFPAHPQAEAARALLRAP